MTTNAQAGSERAGEVPLFDVRVLDVTDSLAGAYCTRMLADGGADVLALEPLSGARMRRYSNMRGRGAQEMDQDRPLWRYLGATKRSALVPSSAREQMQQLVELAAESDVIVWDGSSAVRPTTGSAIEWFQSVAPGAIVVSITPYGLHTSWRDRPSSDAVRQALSGGPATQRGSGEEPPLMIGGNFGDYLVGAFAAAAVLMSLVGRHGSGNGELIDLSELEVHALSQTFFRATAAAMHGSPVALERATNLPGIHEAADGWVGFMVATGQQWLNFCSMIEQFDWLQDERLGLMAERNHRYDELVEVINRWVKARSMEEVLARATEFRVPVAPLGDGSNIPTFDHIRALGFYTTEPDNVLLPRTPYEFKVGPRIPARRPPEVSRPKWAPRHASPRSSNVPGRPLDGLRVVDFTAFWAGPIVGNILAMFGAEVIHVESCVRPDAVRNATLKDMTDDEWWEWSPGFHGANAGKKGITLDMRTEAGRGLALELIECSDVVLENFSSRVMDSWGLDWRTLQQANRSGIYMRMPAYGVEGPWRERVGYAQTIEYVSGLAWITGHPDGSPEPPNCAGDPLAGIHAVSALMLALRHRARTGQGSLIHAPMLGAALAVTAEQVIEASGSGTVLGRQGNRSPHFAPQGYYLTADFAPNGKRDRWVAMTIVTDEQWRALVDLVGPALCQDRWATIAGRMIDHDEIDIVVGDWMRAQPAARAVEQLIARGIPAAEVLSPHEQLSLTPLLERRFFEELKHPVVGQVPYATFPARCSSIDGDYYTRPAPQLGEHNEEIICGLLGRRTDEFAELESAGVIGRRPLGDSLPW